MNHPSTKTLLWTTLTATCLAATSAAQRDQEVQLWTGGDPAPYEPAWARAFGGPSTDTPSDACAVADGFFVVGRTLSFGAGDEDGWIARLAGDGSTVWELALGGTDDDELLSVRPTPDGGCLAVGCTRSFGAGGGDGWAVKLAADGSIDWQRTYGGVDPEEFAEIVESPSGYYVGGSVSSPATGSDVWILELSMGGDVLWQKLFAGELDDHLAALDATSNGLAFAANSNSSFSQDVPGVPFFVPWLVRLDVAGNVLWQRTYNISGGDGWNDLVALPDGGFLAVGEALAMAFFRGDVWAVRLDAAGNIVWDRRLGDHFLFWVDSATKAVALPGGGFVVGGLTGTGGAGSEDFYLVQLDASGAVVWDRILGGAGFDNGTVLALAPDGDLLFGGLAQPQAGASFDTLLMRLEPTGVLPAACGVSAPTDPNQWTSGLSVFDPPLVPTPTTVVPADSQAVATALDSGSSVCPGR